MSQLFRNLLSMILIGLVGCEAAKVYPVNQDVARASLEEALQAWIDGQSPQDLQPGMYVTDPAWEAGKKLASFEILEDEVTEGSNVHLRVKRKFVTQDRSFDPVVKYIISTSPAISIVPQ
jgi:hypothetical protein